MGKRLFIAEKPSVAAEFAKALKLSGGKRQGCIEAGDAIVTWCVGHLVTMCYPESYDPALKKWSMETIPFVPESFRYEIIPAVKGQYDIVAGLLNREDVDTIYVCTDSGREGEYIYRLVDMMAAPKGKKKLRVWIDSQTEEEILRGIREAKPESAYDNLSASAFLRAKEDYLMGINFSRVLTLKYGHVLARALGEKYTVISAGRVMTCVLGMTVRREREIRDFVKTSFYRVLANTASGFAAEWRVSEGSRYTASPKLYKENGFLKKEDAEALTRALSGTALVESVTKKKELKNPPLLYNLAELQNDCAKLFKINPDNTLKIAQELYEKKLTTYPRTDARVLSTAVAKEIHKNIQGLKGYAPLSAFAEEVLAGGAHTKIAKTKYVNDKAITDHYAVIPTGQGLGALRSLNPLSAKVYELICRRFLSIFYPAAEYSKLAVVLRVPYKEQEAESAAHLSAANRESAEEACERFYANFRALMKDGYLKVAVKAAGEGSGGAANAAAGVAGSENKQSGDGAGENSAAQSERMNGTSAGVQRTFLQTAGGVDKNEQDDAAAVSSEETKKIAQKLKKGDMIAIDGFEIREGETSPPKRYTSGSMILAMENAGQLIEDEELRAQIKGSGIGTSATRAEILKKLVNIKYLKLNEKTQVITPTLFGEMVNDVTEVSIRQLLNPELTASWEKGLTYVAEGSVTEAEYMEKLRRFVCGRTQAVKTAANARELAERLSVIKQYYR